MLTNPAYVGDVVFGRRANGRFEARGPRPEGEWVLCRDAHEPIVDRPLFARVQAVLATHKHIQGDIRGTRYLLTGLVYCAHCGSRMYGRNASRGNYAYACYRGLEYGRCQMRGTGGKALDRWVQAQVSRIYITSGVRAAAEAILREEAEREAGEREARRHDLLAARDRHQRERKALARRRLGADIPPDIYRELEEEEAGAIRAIDAELAGLGEAPPAIDIGSALQVLERLSWEGLDAQGWREAVVLLVERVDVVGLGDYRLTWRPAALALLQAVKSVA